MERTAVTIQHVASLAKTSPSTVSNLLNGRTDRMKPETRERIELAMERLNYRPSQIARQLKTGQTPILGLMVPSVANPFWGEFAQQAEATAREHGYQVLLGNAGRDVEAEERYAESLLSLGIRGLIHGSSPLSLEHLGRMAVQGMRVVTFDHRGASPPSPTPGEDEYDSVSVDNTTIARLAVEHLVALGHRRIGLLSGPLKTSSRQLRFLGYRDALEAAGIPFDPSLIWEAHGFDGFGDVEGAELGRIGTLALAAGDRPPTALLAINDMFAFGAYAAVRELNLRIPDELSIVGIDDIVFAALASPPLTTVRQPLQALLAAAIPRVIARVEGRDKGPAQHQILPAELVVRGSTAPPRVDASQGSSVSGPTVRRCRRTTTR